MHRTFVLLLGLAFTGLQEKGGPESKKLKKCELGSVNRIHRLGGVFLAGQPTPEDLKHAKDKGLKTVLNLREKGETDWDEEQAVKKLGLEYVHLPFKSAETLTDETFEKARKLLSDKGKQPILLN
jgi:DSP-PTPase phosphatase fused to NAD+ Kinase